MAGKKGWLVDILGWVPDSSGVYLQFGPLGGGYGFAPAGFPTDLPDNQTTLTLDLSGVNRAGGFGLWLTSQFDFGF